jgi:hypothetical protein
MRRRLGLRRVLGKEGGGEQAGCQRTKLRHETYTTPFGCRCGTLKVSIGPYTNFNPGAYLVDLAPGFFNF